MPTIEDATSQHAAEQFGLAVPAVEMLGSGLIHRTYKATDGSSGRSIVLQCINTNTFPQPEHIIENYVAIEAYLHRRGGMFIPAMIPTVDGQLYWIDEDGKCWRANAFIDNSYAPDDISSASQAFEAARCFATFTRELQQLSPGSLHVIIPGFHDLAGRYWHFEAAITKANIKRLMRCTHIIAELRERTWLVDFFDAVVGDPSSYPQRIMHHDCKVSNILFDKSTHSVICPVDLDTTMPGYFFSDIGDMIRTMACTVPESSSEWELVGIRPDYYESIVQGYLEGIAGGLTEAERSHLHRAGLVMTYMQCMRFVTDYLNNDIYYKIAYEEQNLHRGLNQLILLQQLENWLSGAGLS